MTGKNVLAEALDAIGPSTFSADRAFDPYRTPRRANDCQKCEQATTAELEAKVHVGGRMA